MIAYDTRRGSWSSASRTSRPTSGISMLAVALFTTCRAATCESEAGAGTRATTAAATTATTTMGDDDNGDDDDEARHADTHKGLASVEMGSCTIFYAAHAFPSRQSLLKEPPALPALPPQHKDCHTTPRILLLRARAERERAAPRQRQRQRQRYDTIATHVALQVKVRRRRG
jgi:hypothetical protein